MIAIYLLKSSLCLGILFGFYKLALEHKAMHQFKRYYLLASLIFALTIPLVTFTYTTTEVTDTVWVQDFAEAYDVSETLLPVTENTVPATPILPYVLWSLYGLGLLLFGSRFVLNLVRLKRKITAADMVTRHDFTLALLPQLVVPHSFFKWIFLSQKRYEAQEIAPEVLAHEATHVRQKHSIDILFIEFLQVVFWFNPLFWLSKKSIKLNHEFLADRGALQEESDIYQYQNILLSYASSTDHAALESPFNYSLTKKRILMLSKTISRKRAIVSALLLVPVLTGCLLAFNNAIVAVPETTTAHPIEGVWIDHANENQNISIYEKNDTLWWDQVVMKVPIQVHNNTYSILSAGEKWDLSLTSNDQLQLGSVYFTRPDDRVSYRIDGTWQAANGGVVYTFITKNGQPTCDIAQSINDRATRYYPKRTDNGMALIKDNEKLTFNIKNNTLVMQDGNVLKRIKNMSVYETLEKQESSQESSYAQNFVAGAERNGRKSLVIEIRNNQISINGSGSSLSTLQQEIDAITKDWSAQEYTEAVPSFLFKNNSNDFLQKANHEFKKSHFSKANEGIQLIRSSSTPSTKKQGSKEHLQKMKKLDGLFYQEENEISYEEAIRLIETHPNLNIQTPVPYSDPPRTYLTEYPMLGGYEGVQSLKNEYKKFKAKGDTVVFSNGYDEKFLMVMDDEQMGRVLEERPQDAGVSKKQLDIYNGLAKKYNKQPKEGRKITATDLRTLETIYRKMNTTQKVKNQAFPECELQNPATAKEIKEYNRLAAKYANFKNGKILQSEVARMYDIYSRMTSAQKKTAKAYPALPPPPPPPPAPAPPKVKKGEKSDIPPPPPPKPPKVKKGEKSNIPPPPPPKAPKAPKSPKAKKESKNNGIDEIEEEIEVPLVQEIREIDESIEEIEVETPLIEEIEIEETEIEELEIEDIRATPGAMDIIEVEEEIQVEEPLIDLSQMIAKNANFFWQNKRISSDEAKKVIAANPDIKVRTTQNKASASPSVFFYTGENYRPSPKPTAKNIVNHIKVSNRHNSQFSYEGKNIDYKSALNLVRKNRNLHVLTEVDKNGKYTTQISQKPLVEEIIEVEGEVQEGDHEIDISALIKEGALFYYNGKKITSKRAEALLKNTDALSNIDITRKKGEKPVVRIQSN